MITIKLPRDIDDRLTLLALRTGKSKLYYARKAIMMHLDDLEDRFISALRNSDSDDQVSVDLDFND